MKSIKFHKHMWTSEYPSKWTLAMTGFRKNAGKHFSLRNSDRIIFALVAPRYIAFIYFRIPFLQPVLHVPFFSILHFFGSASFFCAHFLSCVLLKGITWPLRSLRKHFPTFYKSMPKNRVRSFLKTFECAFCFEELLFCVCHAYPSSELVRMISGKHMGSRKFWVFNFLEWISSPQWIQSIPNSLAIVFISFAICQERSAQWNYSFHISARGMWPWLPGPGSVSSRRRLKKFGKCLVFVLETNQCGLALLFGHISYDTGLGTDGVSCHHFAVVCAEY